MVFSALVSSTRRTNVPPVLQAYSQLNNAERALPTCKNPLERERNERGALTRRDYRWPLQPEMTLELAGSVVGEGAACQSLWTATRAAAIG